MDGLIWKTQYKLVPVAYTIKMLVIGATIEDDKISTDTIQEQIEEWEEVQSVDIQSFSKI